MTTTTTDFPLPSAEEAAAYVDPTRARYPDEEGFVERDGVRVFWERYGEGDPAILFFPAWSLLNSRIWQGQIPYFARRHKVIVFDPRGNGRSDRPDDPAAYSPLETMQDALAILDATGTQRAVSVSLSSGTLPAIALAAQHPDRVEKAAFLGSFYPVCDPMPGWTRVPVAEEREDYEGWQHYNAPRDAGPRRLRRMVGPDVPARAALDRGRRLRRGPRAGDDAGVAGQDAPSGRPARVRDDGGRPASGGPALRGDGTSDALPRVRPQRDPGRDHAARLG